MSMCSRGETYRLEKPVSGVPCIIDTKDDVAIYSEREWQTVKYFTRRGGRITSKGADGLAYSWGGGYFYINIYIDSQIAIEKLYKRLIYY